MIPWYKKRNKMAPYHLYKHKNCTDTAIMPIKNPLFIPEKRGYKVKVRWFNIVNPENIFDVDVLETIFISAEHMNDWLLIGKQGLLISAHQTLEDRDLIISR
jgi:hypothetical protein